MSNRKLILESSVSFIFQLSGIGVLYFLIMIITKLLGIDSYGEFVVFLLLGKGLSILFTFGLDGYGVNEFSKLKLHNSSIKGFIFRSLKLISLIILGTLVITFPFYHITPKHFGIDFNTLLSAFFYAIPVGVIKFIIQYFRVHGKSALYSFFEHFFIPIGSLIILLTIILFGIKLTISKIEIVFILVALFELCVVCLLVYFKNKKLNLPNINDDTASIFKSSFQFFVPSIFIFLSINVNSLFINFYMTEVDVGIYDICFKISQIFGLPLMALNVVVAPIFSKHFLEKKYHEINALWIKTIMIGIVLVGPFIIIAFVTPSTLLKLFMENETYHAEFILKLLLLGQLINVSTGSIGILLQMTKNEKPFLYITVFAVSVNLVLNTIIIPEYGMTGSALSNIICFGIINLLSIYIFLKLKINWKN